MATFNQFLQKFPEVSLPLTLSEEDFHTYSSENEPLTERMIEEHILPIEKEAADELTEFIPCCRLPKERDFHALVYFRAGLMKYEYVLASFTDKGQPIDRKVIAGTFSDGSLIVRSVARIDDDWTVYIMSGSMTGSALTYDAARSTTKEVELLPDGKMVELEG